MVRGGRSLFFMRTNREPTVEARGTRWNGSPEVRKQPAARPTAFPRARRSMAMRRRNVLVATVVAVTIVGACGSDRAAGPPSDTDIPAFSYVLPFGDSGPNEWRSLGAGTSQAARLADDDDATFIRAGGPGLTSCVSIDCSKVNPNVLIRSITLDTRESCIQNAEGWRVFQVYVDDVLYWGRLVFRTHAPAFRDYRTRIAGPENGFPPIRIPAARSIEIGFNSAGVQTGERWQIARLRVELGCRPPMNEPDIERETDSGGTRRTAFLH
jgi:hypothetical protein